MALTANDGSASGVSLFGYGELNMSRPRGNAAGAVATAQRGVLGFAYRFNDRTRMAAELEIENAVVSVQGLKNIYTKVQDGAVSITAEFRMEKPVQEAVDDVRSAIQGVRADLPADLRDPIVQKINLAGTPVLAYTVRSARMDDEALSWLVDKDITRKLLSLRGVGAVNRVGGVTREVQVALDPLRLQALNASASDISRQLRKIQQDASGGRTDVGGAEQSVRTIATVRSADELARMDIALSDGRHVRLDQVATVRDGVAEVRSAALLNGQPVVGFEIVRTRGAGVTEVAALVPASEVAVIADAGHSAYFEQAAQFNRLVLDFIGRRAL